MEQIVKQLYTDRQHLMGDAYATRDNLDARIGIYTYQHPQVDLHGWALDQVAWRGDERVLDIGCGPGIYLRRLAERSGGLRLLGFDLSHGMLRDLRRDWRGGALPALANADVQSIPLADASCDVVLAMHMLYHAPDIALAAHELRRVLRPGGTLLAVTNSAEHLSQLDEVLIGALATVSGQPLELFVRNRFTLEEGERFLRPAFEQVQRHDIISELRLPEPGPALRYYASTRSRSAKLVADAHWEAALAEAARMINQIIAEKGAFRIRTHSGVFVCQ